MIPTGSLNALMQALAALVLFVVGYFALLVCVFLCIFVIALLVKGGRWLWLHATTEAPSSHSLAARFAHDLRAIPHFLSTMSRRLAAAHKSST